MDFGPWDRSLLLAINSYAHRSPLFDRIVDVLNADLLVGGILFLYLWWLWFRPATPRDDNRLEAVRIAFGLLVAIAIARTSQFLLPARLRPLHDPSIHLAVPYGMSPDALEHWSSFPSDHAVVFFAMATAIWLRSRRWGFLAYLWALFFTCLPRVYVGFHFPSDILSGAVLGIALMVAALRLPLGGLDRRLLAYLATWERRRPDLFYPAAVLVTYEFVALGNDVRLVGRTLVAILFGGAS